MPARPLIEKFPSFKLHFYLKRSIGEYAIKTITPYQAHLLLVCKVVDHARLVVKTFSSSHDIICKDGVKPEPNSI